MEFSKFKSAVAHQFQKISKGALFVTDVSKDDLWDTYLNSFPDGSNTLYRERRSHDCNSCKQFIKAVGNVVSVDKGKLVTIWDIKIPSDPEYQVVADAMAALVRGRSISNVFKHASATAGVDKTFEQLMGGGVKSWEHFFVNVPQQHQMPASDMPTKLGEIRTTHDMFMRALTEISVSNVDLVLELISQNSLYRGEEHRALLTQFRTALKEFNQLKTDQQKDIYVWTRVQTNAGTAMHRIRNTVIGTLLVDLENGVELEDAVKMFESKVAPANYKRPTALVTPKMLEKARETLTELGLMSALRRRFAAVEDLTINDLLYADRHTTKLITGDVFDELASAMPVKPAQFNRVETVPIQQFLEQVVPTAETIEVLFENRHKNNMVSLVAPCDATAGALFKWDNRFSWSYAGEFADSIKERVKEVGGNVTGELCCRLAWSNTDDLDLHMFEPGGNHIYFGNRGHISPCGGTLDVDMNAWTTVTNPVENIFYRTCAKMKEGVYELQVNQYNQRSKTNVGFTVEIEFQGQKYSFEHPGEVKGRVTVARFQYSKDKGIEFIGGMESQQSSRVVWGLPTQTWQEVSAITTSPNHWGNNAVGNRHYFFMMKGCVNDGSARGFFNEFLKEELTPHRKALEMVGGKMVVEPTDQQLSGLGFSSTQRNTLTCRVKGKMTRVINVSF